MASNTDAILDQFTRQAIPFATAAPIRDEAALRQLVAASGAGSDDTVLDVACGPGIVACAFARVARHVTGVDVTPAMLDQARLLADSQGLTNLTFERGDVERLPFADGMFSLVVSRFAFHHFPDPAGVLREMRRVCRPGGRVVVADAVASEDPARAAAMNRMERLKDPSTSTVLPLSALQRLFRDAGLAPSAVDHYRLAFDLEGMLSRAFPNPGDADRVREIFAAAVDDDAIAMGVHRRGDAIHAAYPVAILVAPV